VFFNVRVLGEGQGNRSSSVSKTLRTQGRGLRVARETKGRGIEKLPFRVIRSRAWTTRQKQSQENLPEKDPKRF